MYGIPDLLGIRWPCTWQKRRQESKAANKQEKLVNEMELPQC